MKTLILASLMASGALAVTGCANTPSPAPSMAATAASVEAARSAGEHRICSPQATGS